MQIEDFLDEVEETIRRKGGECDLSFLGKVVHKPFGTNSTYKDILLQNPDRFEVTGWGPHCSARVLVDVGYAREENYEIINRSFLQIALRSRPGNSSQRKGQYVSSMELLNSALEKDQELRGEVDEEVVVALDCEGMPESLDILQVATSKDVYIIDCLEIGSHHVCSKLRKFFQTANVLKLVHDLHQVVNQLSLHGDIESFRSVLDTQLAAESILGEAHVEFNALMKQLGKREHPSKSAIHEKMACEPDLWKKRPLTSSLIDYAALDVDLLLQAAPKLLQAFGNNSSRSILLDASISRAKYAMSNNGARSTCFDKGNHYKIASAELLQQIRPEGIVYHAALQHETDTKELLQLIPERLRGELIVVKENGFANHSKRPNCAPPAPKDVNQLSDIVLDLGRRPHCWIKDERFFLCSSAQDVLVEQQDIDFVLGKIGGFGSDHRAGLERQLHRISGIYDREHRVVGLTIRAGRFFQGNADMLRDILLGTDSSVLFLGPPGSGKTTIVRDATRMLAESNNVCVIDTSNEIAGDGIIPHECIGLARRIQVPSLDKQGSVMVECVQNHTPHVMVIDEIGRSKEVEAARTVKQRGVRIIGSAHGNLRSLLKNRDLRGLLGGVGVVTLGDAAQESNREGFQIHRS